MPPTFAKATARLATSLGVTIIRKTERGSVAPLFRLEECSLMNGKAAGQRGSESREFVTTRWSLILSAAKFGQEEQTARDALAELCRTYWRPIFLFVRGRGCSVEDAQDLTQDFFVTILKSDWLQHADRNRG